MSTCFRLEERVQMRELFDGRLQQYGIVERIVPDKTSEGSRVLVDERGNYLWVDADDAGYVSILTRYGFQSPVRILEAISAAFNTEFHTEHEPKFWGFSTQEEWDAAEERLYLELRDRFYEDIVKFATGKEHGLSPGTIGMGKGEIAKAMVLDNLDLLLSQNKDELLRVIDERHEQEHPPIRIALNEDDMAFIKNVIADTDDLPRDPNLT